MKGECEIVIMYYTIPYYTVSEHHTIPYDERQYIPFRDRRGEKRKEHKFESVSPDSRIFSSTTF
jgi:hypothetical protein